MRTDLKDAPSLYDEEALTFAAAAAESPGRPNVSTVWRWATVGVHGVTLEWFASGRRRYTTREALRRFRERCTAAVRSQACEQRTTPSPARRKQIAAAEARLRAAGV